MACLRGSVPSFATMVVLYDGRASYTCMLLVVSFLIRLALLALDLARWLVAPMGLACPHAEEDA